MNKIVKIRPSESFKLFIEYSDGFSGTIDLTKMLKHKDYECIRDISKFKEVEIDERTNDIIWRCGASMCKNAVREMLELRQSIENMGLSIDLIK